MRITGGQARGIQLTVPNSNKTRPATDYLREAVFSSVALQGGDKKFLDLFAGTGAYGLECLSRGFEGGSFVEKDPKTLKIIENNLIKVLKSLGKTQEEVKCLLVKMDALKWVASPEFKADIIFVDPPYELWKAISKEWMQRLGKILKDDDSKLIFEAPGGQEFGDIEGLELVKILGKGKHQPAAFIFRKRLIG